MVVDHWLNYGNSWHKIKIANLQFYLDIVDIAAMVLPLEPTHFHL
jgi:hypothetical protein